MQHYFYTPLSSSSVVPPAYTANSSHYNHILSVILVKLLTLLYITMNDTEPATSKALAIPELLETIFLLLSEKDILIGTQRVCKTWRNTVTSSLKLQRKLFMKTGTFL